MTEDALIRNIREELQAVRKELADLRELMTEIRVVIATTPRAKEVVELDKRLSEVEREVKVLNAESLNRRDYFKWLIPVLISVLSTLAVLGLKLWELLG